MSIDQVAARLAASIRGSRSGDVEVVAVETERRFDRDGDEYLLVELVLSPPVAGTDTWPVDDTYELRMVARNEAAGLGLDPSQISLTIRTAGDSRTADEPRHSAGPGKGFEAEQ